MHEASMEKVMDGCPKKIFCLFLFSFLSLPSNGRILEFEPFNVREETPSTQEQMAGYAVLCLDEVTSVGVGASSCPTVYFLYPA